MAAATEKINQQSTHSQSKFRAKLSCYPITLSIYYTFKLVDSYYFEISCLNASISYTKEFHDLL